MQRLGLSQLIKMIRNIGCNLLDPIVEQVNWVWTDSARVKLATSQNFVMTCPLPINPDMQCRFFRNLRLDLSNFLQIQIRLCGNEPCI